MRSTWPPTAPAPAATAALELRPLSTSARSSPTARAVSLRARARGPLRQRAAETPGGREHALSRWRQGYRLRPLTTSGSVPATGPAACLYKL